ncbi:relaxase/mobilization nuclease domain-containing protein [Helicobacter baculiformis]|uniref:Relaxase/mobilization nuclease domain-containing protein n=1 Tax=Helicobacter baculiformis TaxID=427351 RepID=A0ABV7ZG97_9HELI|nr:relaxase/mobilization nuclease domain-containing protein [Helicobacter baculiformis]
MAIKLVDAPLDYKPDLDWIDEIVKPKRARPNRDTYDTKLLIRFNNFVQKGAPSKFIYSETKTPVIIKNIGQMKRAHLKNALVYALKGTDDKLAYTQWFEQKSMKDILEEWTQDFDVLRDCNEAMHLVFSLKEKPDDLTMHNLLHTTFETLRTCMPDYKFALVPHNHQEHAHIHVFINKTNQITKKRLRFATRTDCKEFFHDLREEFSYRINAWLQIPEHLYVNQPSLQALDNLNQRLCAIREEEKEAEKDLASKEEHLNHYNQELLSVGSQAIHKRIKYLEQQAKFYEDKLLCVRQVLSRRAWEETGLFHINPEELQRRATLSKGYNETNKEHFESLDALDVSTLQDLKAHFTQALEQHQQHITHTKESLQAWLDYTYTLFAQQTRGFTLLQKKQAIYEQYQRLDKRYLDKNTLVFISQLKSEIEMQRTTQERNFINPNFLDHIAQALHHQQPTLKNLKHHFYKLKTLEHLVSQLKEVNPSEQERQLFIIHRNQQTLLNIANERLAFLVQRFNTLRQEKEDLESEWNQWTQQYKQVTTQQEQENLLLHPNHIQLNRSLGRTSKSLSFMAKEILSANRFLNTHAQDLPLILQDAKLLLQKLKVEQRESAFTTRELAQTQKVSRVLHTAQPTLKPSIDADGQNQYNQQLPTQTHQAHTSEPKTTRPDLTTNSQVPATLDFKAMMQMLQDQQKTLQTMSQELTELKQQQNNKSPELEQTQQDTRTQPQLKPQSAFTYNGTSSKENGRGHR